MDKKETIDLVTESWLQVAYYWKACLHHERDLARNKFGGVISLESKHFPACLCSWLWLYLGSPVFTTIELNQANIERMNMLFGEEGVFHTSGWCFLKRPNGEYWMVDGIEISFHESVGTLKIKFICDARNANNESFRVK
jgi:hypothetical protein